EGLRRNDEQGLRWIEIMCCLDEVGAVDVRHEPERHIALAVMTQCFVGHDRPEVGATDADVDDVTDPLTRVSLPLTAADAVREVRHLIEHCMDMWYDVLAVHDDRCPSWRTQGNMQHSAVLGDVDLVAAEHRVDALAQTTLLGQFSEQPHRFFRDAILRVIKIQTNRLGRQPHATLGIVSEQIAQMPIVHLFVMRREGFPRRSSVESFNGRLHAAAPFVVSFSMDGVFWFGWGLNFFRIGDSAFLCAPRGGRSSFHNRKPPRKASTLSPPRHPSGSFFSFLTLPAPRLDSNARRSFCPVASTFTRVPPISIASTFMIHPVAHTSSYSL